MSLLQKFNEAKHHSHGNYDTKLIVNREMIRQASGNKFSFIATISPENFLKLTTSENLPFEFWKKECQSVEDYNRFARNGELIIMPALWIEGDTVRAFEGRMRAAATICAGGKLMPVAVRLYPVEKDKEKYGPFDAVYDMKYEDMAPAIHSRTGNNVVLKSDFHVVVDGWRNLRQHASQLSEARYTVDAAQVADMYEKWRTEMNHGSVRYGDDTEIYVLNAGYNSNHKPPVAYVNLEVEAKTKQQAIDKAVTYLRYSAMPVPYTQVDAIGIIDSMFEGDPEMWFVSVWYQ